MKEPLFIVIVNETEAYDLEGEMLMRYIQHLLLSVPPPLTMWGARGY